MTSHQKLQEEYVISVEDKALLGDKTKQRCNLWTIALITQSTVIIGLVLYICGAFDILFDTAESSSIVGALEEGSLVLNEDENVGDEPEQDEGDKYLTGSFVAPNVVFLLADDVGWGDIGAHEADYSTPNIDAILSDGIELTRFYTHTLCTPSRMALLTGRYSWKLGFQYQEVVHGMMTGHIPFDEVTYAEVTKEMGYKNYYVGRWGAGYASWDMTPLNRGWDKYSGYLGCDGGYYNYTTDHFEWRTVFDMWDMREPFLAANMTYSEDVFLSKAFEYLEEVKVSGEPFTLTYGSRSAHPPIDDDWPTNYPPIIYPECAQADSTYIGREYFCNKVKYLDYTWGKLIKYLKDNDLYDNTLIFITTDNGATPYSESSGWTDWGSNWPLRGGKVTHYEGGIRVFGGMSGGLIPEELRGTTFDELTHVVDIAATIMRMSMTQKQFEERSTLTGSTKVVDGKNLFTFEQHDLIVHSVNPQSYPGWMGDVDYDYAATDGEWKYYVGGTEWSRGGGWYNTPERGMVTIENDPETFSLAGGWCLDGCLFHLLTDPTENYDVSADYPEILDYYQDLIDAIHFGGFDEEYHSGQPNVIDFRAYQADGIMRPYLNKDSITEYDSRTKSVDSTFNYDYSSYPMSYIGDYNGTYPFDD